MNNRVHQGHLARKRFGQNFLNDQFVIDSIVSAINPQKGQLLTLADGFWSVHSSTVPGGAECMTLLVLNAAYEFS